MAEPQKSEQSDKSDSTVPYKKADLDKMLEIATGLNATIGTDSKSLVSLSINKEPAEVFCVLRVSDRREIAAATLPKLVEVRNKMGMTRDEFGFNVVDKMKLPSLTDSKEAEVRDGDFLISLSDLLAYDKKHGDGSVAGKLAGSVNGAKPPMEEIRAIVEEAKKMSELSKDLAPIKGGGNIPDPSLKPGVPPQGGPKASPNTTPEQSGSKGK